MTIPGVTAVEVAGCRLRSVGKVSYVAENEAILRRIPHFPSARLSRSYSIGETASDTCLPLANGKPYGSYTTTHVYTTFTPRRRGAVVRYYRKLLLAQGMAVGGPRGLLRTTARQRVPSPRREPLHLGAQPGARFLDRRCGSCRLHPPPQVARSRLCPAGYRNIRRSADTRRLKRIKEEAPRSLPTRVSVLDNLVDLLPVLGLQHGKDQPDAEGRSG